MITTIVMSYQFWHYIGFTARRLRFNIIIGHLLHCLHCFEGFMYVRPTHCPALVQKGLMSAPEVERLGMEAVELRVTLLLSWDGGGRHLKGLTAVAFTLALIVFALIWFGAAMLCSVILPWSLPSLKGCSGKDTEWLSLCLHCCGQCFHPSQ